MSQSADQTNRHTPVEAVDEATPLLLAPASGPTQGETGHAHPQNSNGKANGYASIQNQPQHSDDDKPMPYKQILILCYASLAEPTAYFAIFPFINEMIKRNGNVKEEDVGFWSGMIESLFSVVQMLLMIFYGRMADRLGRKPVLVFSLTGVSLATALFGTAQSLVQMMLFRCLAGVFAGSVVTVRTMISENTNKRTQGRAFSWYMFTRNLGIFIGPLIGGGLANPADQFPDTFGHLQFFHDYPYALSTFAAGAICMTGTLSAFIFLKETLQRKGTGAAAPPMTTWDVLKSPGVPIVLFIFANIMFLSLGFTAVSPVFLFTSIEKGGFGFNPQRISYYLALAGASQALWMLLAFPLLQQILGTGTLLRMCSVVWPFFMAMFPVFNELLRHGWTTAFWVIGPILLVLSSGVSMSFACIQLALNDVSPNPQVLATVNALALSVTSGVRAVAPALFTSVYATGVKLGWADGQLAWIVLVVLAAAAIVAVKFLPESAEGRPEAKQTATQTEDDDGP